MLSTFIPAIILVFNVVFCRTFFVLFKFVIVLSVLRCVASYYLFKFVLGLWCLKPLSTIFQLCRGRSILLSEETGVPGENHPPDAIHWQTLSNNIVSSTPRLSGILTHNVSGDRYRLHTIRSQPRLPQSPLWYLQAILMLVWKMFPEDMLSYSS